MMDSENGGFILFDHFSHFCITQHIDFQVQDDDQEALQGLQKDEKDPSKVKYKHFKVYYLFNYFMLYFENFYSILYCIKATS